MIDFYCGVPGSGKSLHAAEYIYKSLQNGVNVIANFQVDVSLVKPRKNKPLGVFIYVPNSDLLNDAYRKKIPDHFSYIDGLCGFAENFHKRNNKEQFIEGQTLLVFDECQELFNSRSWNRKDRLAWASWFRQHRKYGYDVLLISQDDGCIDKQIRAIMEFNVLHRNCKNYRFLTKLLAYLCGGNLFVFVTSMYGMKSKKDSYIRHKYFKGKKLYYDFYNSYKIF